MVITDAIAGLVNNTLWFHYDLTGDVLYLRQAAHRASPTVAEETPEGILLLKTQEHDELVGVTVADWWRRFGTGDLPDSMQALARHIEPWGDRCAA